MIGNPFLRVDELPPRPDRCTGEPRPPRAPDFRSVRPAPDDRAAETSKSVAGPGRPEPPDGEGPVLAWRPSDRFAQLRAGAVAFALQALGVCVLQGFSLAWVSVLWAWLVILVFSVLVAAGSRQEALAVGVEWLRVGRRWVRLYELAEIDTTRRNSDLHVRLADREGHRVTVNAEELRQRPLMWDLVYNGMLHSVIAGAAKTQAYGVLNLPRPADQEL